MRTLTVYRHGLTMGTAPTTSAHTRAIRSEVAGWSESATRRNTAFLRSADETALPSTSDGRSLNAFAFTLTLRDCPPTPAAWAKLRKSFLDRLRRLGLYRSHWVTEWQRRGVPHLHGAFWFESHMHPERVIEHWLELARPYYALHKSQHYNLIHDAVGWFKYLSKHASRGITHYQRSPENIPPEWSKKTGRVWGHTGDWPTIQPMQFELDDQGYFKLRRLYRNWRHADARESGCRFRISHARRMLSCSLRTLSAVRGVSEWVPESVQLSALYWLRSEGCQVVA